jgi:hypothetical protein
MGLIKQIGELVRIPGLIFLLRRSYKAQRQFMEASMLQDLNAFIKDNEGHLSESDISKMRFYYGLAVPVIGEIYKQLWGSGLSDAERRTLTYLGAATGLFDDFFDQDHVSLPRLRNMLLRPDLNDARTPKERLFIQFYLKALEHSNAELIKQYCIDIYEAQVNSVRQSDPELPLEEITAITKEKGGVSILLYRAALERDISEQEKELILQIGFLGQLENDIFDIYKDHIAGIRTLATTAESFSALRETFTGVLSEVYRRIDHLNFPERNKRRFARLFSAVASRGLVCLDQLQALETEHLNLSDFTRKQLICDMGTVKNNWKWIGYHTKHNEKL